MVGTATPATYSAGVGSVSRTDISNQSYVIFTGLAPSTYHYLDITNGAAVLGVRTGTQSGATMASLAANGRRTAMVPSDSSGRITLTAVTNATATSFTVHEFKAVPGAHMSQITGGARPTLRAGSPYYTEYDGSDDNLLGTALAGTANTLAARITVPASIAATQAIMGLQGSSTTRLWLALNTSGQLCGAVGSNGVGTILGSADIRGQTGVAILTHDGSTINLCWNGILVYTGSQNGSPSTTTPFRYGAQNNAGSAGNYTTAQLHKLLSKQAALSLPEIAALSAAWR